LAFTGFSTGAGAGFGASTTGAGVTSTTGVGAGTASIPKNLLIQLKQKSRLLMSKIYFYSYFYENIF